MSYAAEIIPEAPAINTSRPRVRDPWQSLCWIAEHARDSGPSHERGARCSLLWAEARYALAYLGEDEASWGGPLARIETLCRPGPANHSRREAGRAIRAARQEAQRALGLCSGLGD